MTDLAITSHPAGEGVLRLTLTGEVDLATVEQLREAIDTAITTEHTAELVVDLGSTPADGTMPL